MSLALSVSSEILPENLECLVSNSKWQELIALLSVLVPDGFKINRGNTVPDPEDRIWPWKRTNADGTPDRWYEYVGGSWLSDDHWAFTGMVVEFEGLEADIEALDGNADAPGTVVTPTAGPFWEKVDEMDGKIPIGPGQITAGPPIVSIAINANAGAYNVQLSNANIRHHRHHVLARQSVTGGSLPTGSNQVADDGGGNAQENYLMQGTGTPATRGRSSFVESEDQDATNEAFPILPQVRGIFFIRKTARRHRRI